jgi:hypothetical protein
VAGLGASTIALLVFGDSGLGSILVEAGESVAAVEAVGFASMTPGNNQVPADDGDGAAEADLALLTRPGTPSEPGDALEALAEDSSESGDALAGIGAEEARERGTGDADKDAFGANSPIKGPGFGNRGCGPVVVEHWLSI